MLDYRHAPSVPSPIIVKMQSKLLTRPAEAWGSNPTNPYILHTAPSASPVGAARGPPAWVFSTCSLCSSLTWLDLPVSQVFSPSYFNFCIKLIAVYIFSVNLFIGLFSIFPQLQLIEHPLCDSNELAQGKEHCACSGTAWGPTHTCSSCTEHT